MKKAPPIHFGGAYILKGPIGNFKDNNIIATDIKGYPLFAPDTFYAKERYR